MAVEVDGGCYDVDMGLEARRDAVGFTGYVSAAIGVLVGVVFCF